MTSNFRVIKLVGPKWPKKSDVIGIKFLCINLLPIYKVEWHWIDRSYRVLFLFLATSFAFCEGIEGLKYLKSLNKWSKNPKKENPTKTPKVPPMFPIMSGIVILASFVTVHTFNSSKFMWTKVALFNFSCKKVAGSP